MPRPLTREHFIAEVRGIVILSNRLKGNARAFNWEDWMYFYIQFMLNESAYLDWGQAIVERLHQSLNRFAGMSGFFMSSYLFYMIACTQDWNGLHHEPWIDDIKVYKYYPHL